MFVGSCETEESGSPQSGQKCAAPGTEEPHFEQEINARAF
jgi:hypothetical protein